MILPSTLRIGNILSVCYEPELLPYKVEILQADLVHFSNKQNADDPRDIVGFPIILSYLLSNNFLEVDQHYIARYKNHKLKVEVKDASNSIFLYVNKVKYSLNYIHELQNKIFYITGWELNNVIENVDQK